SPRPSPAAQERGAGVFPFPLTTWLLRLIVGHCRVTPVPYFLNDGVDVRLRDGQHLERYRAQTEAGLDRFRIGVGGASRQQTLTGIEIPRAGHNRHVRT